MFEIRGRLMKDGVYEPAQMKQALWRKDMDIIGRFARKIGVELPLFATAGPLYAAAAAAYPEADTAAVYEVIGNGSDGS